MCDKSNHDSKRSSSHTSTIQLGGRGTVRRRRYRKNANLSENQTSESMRNFLIKHQFQDYGQMERVSFVYENGDITSYESVKLAANLKNGFYNFNLNTHTKTKRSNSKSSNLSKTNTRIDKAGELFHTLDFIKQQTQICDLDKETQDRLNILTDEIYQLVGTDAYEFLSKFSQKSHVYEKSVVNFSNLIEESDFIPVSSDFEKVSEEKSDINDLTVIKDLTISSSTSVDPISFSNEPEVLVKEKIKVNKKPKKKKKTKAKIESVKSSESENSLEKKTVDSVEEKKNSLPNSDSKEKILDKDYTEDSTEEKATVDKNNSKLIKKEKHFDDARELRNMAFLRTNPLQKKKKKKDLTMEKKKQKLIDSSSKTNLNRNRTKIFSDAKKTDTTNWENLSENNKNSIPLSNLSTDESLKLVDKNKIKKKIFKTNLMTKKENEDNEDIIMLEVNKKNTNKPKKKKKIINEKTNLEIQNKQYSQISNKLSNDNDKANKISEFNFRRDQLLIENVKNNLINDNQKQNLHENQNKISKSIDQTNNTFDNTNRCYIIMENLDRTRLEIEELTQGVISRQSISSIETPSSVINQSFSDSVTELKTEEIKSTETSVIKKNDSNIHSIKSNQDIELLIEKIEIKNESVENDQRRLKRCFSTDDKEETIQEADEKFSKDNKQSISSAQIKKDSNEPIFSSLKIISQTSSKKSNDKQSKKNTKSKLRQNIEIINNDEVKNRNSPVQEILIEENLKFKTEMFYEKKVYIHETIKSSYANSFSKNQIIDIYNYNEADNENLIYKDINKTNFFTKINKSTSTSKFFLMVLVP